jgi:ribosome-associated toxin RatA of RatAB toxin-antitoxin module
MNSIRRSLIVPYSAHEMFVLVDDIPSYPQFLPWCSGARVLERQGDTVIAAIDIAYGAVHKTFTTRNIHQPDKMIEIRLLDGPFSHLQGFWQFHALGEQSCQVALALDFEVSNRLLALVLTPVFTNIANQLVDSFHQRARALYGERRG